LVAAWVSVQAAASPAVVKVASPTPVTLAPGATLEVRLSVTVKKGFHVQANPASEPYLVPVRLEMEAPPFLRLAKPVYPRGKPYRLAGAESDLSTYAGTFEVRLPLEAPADAQPSEVTLKGRLHYQACDDRICLSPASVPVSLLVKVAPP
jgi:hypothetical protein